MNCRRCQDEVHEYLDGTLPGHEHVAVEKHIAGCPSCRQAVAWQRQLAKGLSDGLHRATESLTLPANVRRQVLRAAAEAPIHRRDGFWAGLFGTRAAWLAAAAGSILFAVCLAAVYLRLTRGVRSASTGSVPAHVSVAVRYEVSSYTFRREGGFVIDALTCEINTVEARLLPTQEQGSAAKQKELNL